MAVAVGSPVASEPGVNHSPSLVTPDIIELPEERDVVITLNGEDVDGDGLKYSILGGTDHAVFDIAPEGRISFKSIPDFESPADVGGDNVYEVSVQVSDGSAVASAELTVVILDVVEGRVVDDPIAGAQVFLDLNHNYRLDSDEPRGVSDTNGYFAFDRQTNNGATDVNVIALGGKEVGSEFPLATMALFSDFSQASSGFITLSPITTMLTSIDDHTTKAEFLQAMGITQSVSAIYAEDVWAAALAGNSGAQNSQRINHQLALLLMVIECLIEMQIEPNGVQISKALGDSLVALSLTGNPSLSDSTDVQSILMSAVADIDSASLPDAAVLAVIANAAADINGLLGSEKINPTVALVSMVKQVARTQLVSSIKSLLLNEITVQDFIAQTRIATLFADVDPGVGYMDTDGDGLIDLLDSDSDNDGVPDLLDAFPAMPGESTDTDGDGVGNNTDTDDDGDGISDSNDAFPLDASETLDTDGDGVGNNADTDDDGDGVADAEDVFPLNSSETEDLDGDGVGNNADLDDDGDVMPDSSDAFPMDAAEFADTDGDGVGNNADTDDDGDGVIDSLDAFPLDAAETLDTDNDGQGNNADVDDDNDGAADIIDAFPLNPSETMDSDGDGIGNNSDTDDDGDGIADSNDSSPLDANETLDTDGDGIGDNTDTDDDGDETPDTADAFPLDATEAFDTDGDGIGNNADSDDDGDGVAISMMPTL